MHPRILVADDLPHMRQLLCRIIGHELGPEAEVSTARDGTAALELLARCHFHLVVTDLRMPGANGLQVLREVKRASPGTEVLIVTGFADAAHLREAEKLGAFCCIPKPFDPDVLGQRVREALALATQEPPGLH